MEFRPSYLAREWIAAGHQVMICAASYSHIRAKQPIIIHQSITSELIDGIKYFWYPTLSYQGNGYRRVLSMISFISQLWLKARSIAKEFKPDVVIASSTYPMDIWPAQRIAKLSNAKLVYEVHDLWPLSPIELGGMSRLHPFIVWVQYAEDYAYKNADLVVSMLPKTFDYMVSRGLSPYKWAYVPNGVVLNQESSTALPDELMELIGTIKSSGLPIICYTGTCGVANALDVLLDASKRLDGYAHILLVGTGPEWVRLSRRIVSENLSNVTILPSIPKSCIPALLKDIDIAYLGWHANPLYRFGISPNKLMDYMLAGKPIIHSADVGNDIVSEIQCGITVEPNNSEAIANAALELISMPTELKYAMGQRGKAYVIAERTYKKLAISFMTAIKSNV
jgi:glycosyltransferase involved in cell wall biosynthesis